jgi:ankyrin repeat protein
VDLQVDEQDNNGQTPLHLACIHGLNAIAGHLLNARAMPNVYDNKGKSPGFYAVEANSVSCLQLLLSNRANVQAFDKSGHTMLWTALSQQRNECLDVLLKNSPNLFEEYGKSKDTPMHVATEIGYVYGVRQLLSTVDASEVQMLTESANAKGHTALATAVHNAQPAVFQLLVDSGAAKTPQTADGDTLLHVAAKAELASSALVASIVDDCMVDVNKTNKAGLSALHIASGHDSFDTAVRVRLLVLHKASINQPDSEGKTALHHAALGGTKDQPIVTRDQPIVTRDQPILPWSVELMPPVLLLLLRCYRCLGSAARAGCRRESHLQRQDGPDHDATASCRQVLCPSYN